MRPWTDWDQLPWRWKSVLLAHKKGCAIFWGFYEFSVSSKNIYCVQQRAGWEDRIGSTDCWCRRTAFPSAVHCRAVVWSVHHLWAATYPATCDNRDWSIFWTVLCFTAVTSKHLSILSWVLSKLRFPWIWCSCWVDQVQVFVLAVMCSVDAPGDPSRITEYL